MESATNSKEPSDDIDTPAGRLNWPIASPLPPIKQTMREYWPFKRTTIKRSVDSQAANKYWPSGDAHMPLKFPKAGELTAKTSECVLTLNASTRQFSLSVT
jgi:hypothetical protein